MLEIISSGIIGTYIAQSIKNNSGIIGQFLEIKI